MEFSHISVLLHETVESLNVKPDGIYVDCTLGGAGHTSLILSKLDVKVIIPMHYRNGDIGYGVLDTLDKFESLIKDRPAYDYGNEIEITAETEKQLAVLSL